MALQFIIGSAGSGKSRILYKNLIDKSLKYTDKNFIAVVPEQYSMEAQKEILNLHPQGGSFNIEVAGLTRLAYMVFEKMGVSGYKVMDDLGKTLVVRKVLEECKKDLVMYKDKTSMPGFTEKMKMIVSEFKQYSIDEETLSQMKESVEKKPILRRKLDDIQVVYSHFNEYVKEKNITPEDVLSIFCKYIPESNFIKNTYFYFDSFTGFTPSQYQVIELLMKYGAGVSVAITLPEYEKDFKGFGKYELFSLSKETILKLTELADMNGVLVEQTVVAGEGDRPYRIRNNEQLCFLEKNIFRNESGAKYDKPCDAIEIHSLSEPGEEVEYVAGRISYLVKNKGYRYNDIAVITGDMETYHRYLEEYFERYDIPAFIDYKRDITSNPFVQSIKAVIEVLEKDFSYESVFQLLRLGILDIDRNTVDLLENYVLRSGRRGFKSYSQKWQKCYEDITENNLAEINKGREKLIETIKPLRERFGGKIPDSDESDLPNADGEKAAMNLDGAKSPLAKKCREKPTVADRTKALYEFILTQDIYQKIDAYAQTFREQKKLSKAKEYEQTYQAIISVLDKTVAMLGEERVSIAVYKQILQAGFESVKVGIIPPGLDTVMVGNIERTRLKDTKKIIFFIGVNDTVIPGSGTGDGVITDDERRFLEECSYTLAPTARDNVFRQRLYLYSLLTKPTEKVCISYSRAKSDKTVLRKSYLIGILTNLFSQLQIVEEKESKDIYHITNKREALDYVAENIQNYRLNRDDKTFEQICSVLSQDDQGKSVIENIADAAFYKNKKDRLDKVTAAKLYGIKDNMGTTRLERYAACAYSQFLNRGLKLNDRRKFEIATFDIGNLYHDTVYEYFREVQKENILWADLDDDTNHRIIDECTQKVMDEYDNDALNETARNMFIKEQVRVTAEKTADVLVKHIRKGKFEPAEYELQVGHGRIDRVDVAEDGDKLYVKVIDYKSGDKKFCLTDTYMGLQMQLMVYLKDAMDYEKRKHPDKNVYPAGALYFHIHDPYVDKPDFDRAIADYREENPDSKLTDDEIRLNEVKKEQYKKYRMTGMVNSDVVGLMDADLLNQAKTSDIIPARVTNFGLQKSDQVMDTDTYTKFIDYVVDMAEDMKEAIIKGDISLNPVEEACTYCPYDGVCRFDRKLGDGYKKKVKKTKEEIEEELNEKSED